MVRSTLWLTTILAAILFVAAGSIVDLLYTSRFSASAAVVRILVPGIVLFAAARVLGNDIAARGRPLVNSVVASASVVCNIGLNVVLDPPIRDRRSCMGEHVLVRVGLRGYGCRVSEDGESAAARARRALA